MNRSILSIRLRELESTPDVPEEGEDEDTLPFQRALPGDARAPLDDAEADTLPFVRVPSPPVSPPPLDEPALPLHVLVPPVIIRFLPDEEEEEPITLVFRSLLRPDSTPPRRESTPPPLPAALLLDDAPPPDDDDAPPSDEDQARSCLFGPGNDLPEDPGNGWPVVEQAERNFPGSEAWHEGCNGESPARSEDDMASMEIEYDVVDLEGDLDGGPARPSRHVPEDIAMLSGGLFDSLPRVDVPLETFFPAEYKGSPAWHRERSDSLIPTALPALEEAPAPKVGPSWFVGMAAAAVIGLAAGAIAQRPATPTNAAPPPPAPRAELSVSAPEPPVEAAAPAPAAPAKVVVGTGSIQNRPARPAPSPTPAAPAPPESSATAIESMPIVVAPKPAPPPPEAPAQATTAIAIASAAGGAASCLDPDDLRRTMAVAITFAPSGRATRAVIEGGPHRATPAGSCIAQRLRSATVKPFEGPPVTIHTSIRVR